MLLRDPVRLVPLTAQPERDGSTDPWRSEVASVGTSAHVMSCPTTHGSRSPCTTRVTNARPLLGRYGPEYSAIVCRTRARPSLHPGEKHLSARQW